MTEDIDTIPDDSTVEETAENMRERGFEVIVAENSDEALDEIKDLIEKGSEVQWGSSTTLSEIGFEEWIEDADVENLKQEIWSIDDDEKRSEARRDSVTADNFLGGINAISREGQLVSADKSGSRVGAYPYAAKNLILVSGVNKITEDLESARERLREHVYPKEDERAQEEYGVGSDIAKEFIFHSEHKEGRTTVILINRELGF